MPDIPDVRSLAELCAEVIGVRTVAVEENFLDAGGDSVTAARLAVLLQEHWGMELDIFTIIAADSLNEIHELLRGRAARNISGQPG
jgi:aryl carrier-like protein